MGPKKQQIKMAIGDFLTDQSLGSWADEMDDQPMPTSSGFGGERRTGGGMGGAFGGDRGFGNDRGGGGGFGDRARTGFREQLPLPSRPPYTAHLGNLSFDVTEGDVQDFLSGCDVSSVRIVEDKMDRRPKGFGYVEFGTLDGLKKALELSETQFQGRNIRISVADPPKGGEGGRELNDWTRKGPLPDLPGQGMRRGPPERGGSFRGGFDAASDAGSDRGSRRPAFFEGGDAKVRDFGNWERKGPLSPVERSDRPAGGSMRGRGGGDAPRERRPSATWGEGRAEGRPEVRGEGSASGSGRSETGSRPPRREFQERPAPEKVPTAADMDSQWRSRMKPDAPSPAATPEASTPSSPATAAPPTSRPRLNLQKRTVSEAQPNAEAGASDNKASPFGAARPIDTSARDKEIEEKRHLAIRQRKEQDDKSRDEKRAKEAAAKAEKVSSPAEKSAKEVQPKANGKDEENDNESAAPSKQYEILRREENDDEEVDADAVDENDANGDIIDDKQVLPQEIVREVPKGGDSSRKSSAGAAAATEPATTAEAMADDGWSTVTPKQKNTKSRGGATRAMAS